MRCVVYFTASAESLTTFSIITEVVGEILIFNSVELILSLLTFYIYAIPYANGGTQEHSNQACKNHCAL